MWKSTLRRNLRKALVGGLSTVATVAMLGMSGQVMAVDMSGPGTWKVSGGLSGVSSTNPVDLKGNTLTIDKQGAAANNIGAITDTTGGGDIIVTSTADGAATNTLDYTIASIDLTTAGSGSNIDFNMPNNSNALVTITVTGNLKTSGYLNLTNSETDGDGDNVIAASTTSGFGDIVVTVGGDLSVGAASTFTGQTGGSMLNTSADVTLKLQGTNNAFTGDLTFDAFQPGGQGKTILDFNGSSAQNFTGTLLAETHGDGLVKISGAGATFNSNIGTSTKGVNSISLVKAGGTSATFKGNLVSSQNGIILGAGSGGTYTTTFDSSVGNIDIYARAKKGGTPDTSDIVITGSNTVTQQGSGNTYRWGLSTTPLSSITTTASSGVTFNSNSAVFAENVTINSGTTANFNDVLTVTNLNIQGIATFANAVKNADSSLTLGANGSVTYHAENNLPDIKTLTGSGGKIILTGTPLAATGKTVLGSTTNGNSNPNNKVESSGMIVIELGPATDLNIDDYIIIVDGGDGTAADAADLTIKVSETRTDIDFVKDTDTADQIRIKAIAVTGGSGLPYPQNHAQIITGVKQIARDMRDQPVRAASARMKSERFAKYSRTAFRFGDAGSREFQRTDGPGSRNPDGRGFQRTNDRGLRDADGRGFQRSNEGGLRDAENRGLQKGEDRKLREGDDRGFRKGEDRKLREAEDRGLQKAEDRKLREAEERKLREAEEGGSQKPVDRPTGVSFGDSPIMPENAWMEAFGDWVDQDSKTSRQGNYTIDGYDADIYGVAIGVDTEVVSDVLLGVAFSYSNADVDWLGASKAAGDIDHYQLTLYGEYRHDKFYIEGMLGYAMNDYDISDLDTTDDSTRKSDFDSNQYLARLELGVPIYMGNEIFITPRAELDWDRLDVDGYTQTGTGNNLLIVNPNDWDSTTASLGVEVRQRIKKDKGYIIPSAYAGVSYDLAGEEASVSAALTNAPTTLYSIRGMDNEQFATEVELGLEYEVGQWSVGAKYEGRFKATRDSHSASLLAQYRF